MPLRLNIGLNKKVGEANYGSRGASVNLEIELDSQLVADPGKLQERIRQCFGMVRASLDEELSGGNGNAATSNSNANGQNSNGNGNGNGNGRFAGNQRSGGRQATQSQIKAIHAICRRQRIDLSAFLQERFHVQRPDDLSIQDASSVIDELKSSATGS